MSGIYPTNGVAAGTALNTVDVDTTNCTAGELFYSTTRCQPRFDPAQANAMISELLNVTACAGTPYDCSRLDNLCTAIKALQTCACPPGSGIVPPVAAPGDKQSVFYIDTSTAPDTMYWWDGANWYQIGNCCQPSTGVGDPVAAPAAGTANFYLDTTNPANPELFWWNGAAWFPVSACCNPAQAAAVPVAAPADGTSNFYFDTTNPLAPEGYWWDGAAWHEISTCCQPSQAVGVPVAAPPAGTANFYFDTTNPLVPVGYWWDGAAWRPLAAGGTVIVQQDGVTVQAAATTLNMIDLDFEVLAPAAGVASIRRKHLRPLGAPIVFAASGTYTPSGLNVAAIQVMGVGGGGGTVGHQTGAGEAFAAAGANGGSSGSMFIERPTTGAIVIGAGGAAGVTGAALAGGGGTTSYTGDGRTMTLPGGGGGFAETTINNNALFLNTRHVVIRAPTGFNPPTGGDAMMNSTYGTHGHAVWGAENNGVSIAIAGTGGPSPFGNVGIPRASVSNGPAAQTTAATNTGFGAGANGCSAANGGTALGAGGSPGVIVIQEFERV